ncbi:MAG: hypothetical protein ACI4QT_01095 [Kiritimatiellia bacterium]
MVILPIKVKCGEAHAYLGFSVVVCKLQCGQRLGQLGRMGLLGPFSSHLGPIAPQKEKSILYETTPDRRATWKSLGIFRDGEEKQWLSFRLQGVDSFPEEFTQKNRDVVLGAAGLR